MAFKWKKKSAGRLVPSGKSKAVSKKTFNENLYLTRYFSSMRVSHKSQHFGGNSEMSEDDSVVCQRTVSKEWENIYAGGYV